MKDKIEVPLELFINMVNLLNVGSFSNVPFNQLRAVYDDAVKIVSDYSVKREREEVMNLEETE